MPSDKIISSLNHLVAIANDGKYGFENAAKDVEDVTLKQLFLQYSAERNTYVTDLKNLIEQLGGKPDDGGGPLGALHRTWMDIKSTFTAADREAILNACITGEQAAEKAYTETLKEEIPQEAKSLLVQQLSGIEASLNSLRSLVATVA